jgi:hypothetical protein
MSNSDQLATSEKTVSAKAASVQARHVLLAGALSVTFAYFVAASRMTWCLPTSVSCRHRCSLELGSTRCVVPSRHVKSTLASDRGSLWRKGAATKHLAGSMLVVGSRWLLWILQRIRGSGHGCSARSGHILCRVHPRTTLHCYMCLFDGFILPDESCAWCFYAQVSIIPAVQQPT